jgi:PIN domain nuclease of toxin-antitoxin system
MGKAAYRACDAALATDELAVPTVVFYEVGRLAKRGHLTEFTTVHDWRVRLLAMGVREIPLTSEIAILAADLEELHGDPLDRVIVATALVEEAILLTADRPVLAWSGKLRRQDARR